MPCAVSASHGRRHWHAQVANSARDRRGAGGVPRAWRGGSRRSQPSHPASTWTSCGRALAGYFVSRIDEVRHLDRDCSRYEGAAALSAAGSSRWQQQHLLYGNASQDLERYGLAVERHRSADDVYSLAWTSRILAARDLAPLDWTWSMFPFNLISNQRRRPRAA